MARRGAETAVFGTRATVAKAAGNIVSAERRDSKLDEGIISAPVL
jgi:hypothetical protein